jgi:hypothetical protein
MILAFWLTDELRGIREGRKSRRWQSLTPTRARLSLLDPEER